MSFTRSRPLTLEETEIEVRGHQFVEDALFRLCGAWSTDPATASGPAGAEVQAFFAEQSSFHAWRAAQWAERRPRSVDSAGDVEVAGWSTALGVSRSQGEGPDRLACWAVALQPSLAARYHGHRRALAPAADSGLDRWLGLALGDVLEGCVSGRELLSRAIENGHPRRAAKAGADALASILGP